MKKLLCLLMTTPLVLTSCGGTKELDEIDALPTPEEDSIYARAYALTDGEFIYDNYSGNSHDYKSGNPYFYVYDLNNNNGWSESVHNDPDSDWNGGSLPGSTTKYCTLFYSQNEKDILALMGSVFSPTTTAGEPMEENGYNYTTPTIYRSDNVEGAGQTRDDYITTSGNVGQCFISKAFDFSINATSATIAESNLSIAQAELDSDGRTTAISINETEKVNGEYIWTDGYQSSQVDINSHKIVDYKFANEIYQAHDEIEWKYEYENRNTEWYKTLAEVRKVYTGLTLAEAQAVDLTGNWLPTVVAGANEDLRNIEHYGNVIVEAIKLATESTAKFQ